MRPERNFSVQVHGSGTQKSAINTKSLLLFGGRDFYLRVISRALVYGCMLAMGVVCWHSPAKGFFSLACWQSAGLQPLHHAAFRYHPILLYPTVPLYKTTTLALHGAGVVVFCGFAGRITEKPDDAPSDTIQNSMKACLLRTGPPFGNVQTAAHQARFRTRLQSKRAAGREPSKAAETLPPAGPCEDYSSLRYQVKLFASFFSKKR